MKKRMAKKEIPQNEPLNNEIVTNETEVEEVPESRGKRIANTVVNAVLVLAIALAAVCTYVSYVSSSGNGRALNLCGCRSESDDLHR